MTSIFVGVICIQVYYQQLVFHKNMQTNIEIKKSLEISIHTVKLYKNLFAVSELKKLFSLTRIFSTMECRKWPLCSFPRLAPTQVFNMHWHCSSVYRQPYKILIGISQSTCPCLIKEIGLVLIVLGFNRSDRNGNRYSHFQDDMVASVSCKSRLYL